MLAGNPKPVGASQSPPENLGERLRRLRRGRRNILMALVAVAIAAFALDLSTGSAGIALRDLLATLLAPGAQPDRLAVVIWQLRLPFALMAVLVGMALALAGAEMQTILANPLASPFTLGVSSAASLGAALALMMSAGIPGVADEWLLLGNTFVFAWASVMLLQMVGNRTGNAHTLLLFGIALVFSCNAAVALLQFLAAPDALQQYVFWSMGSLTRSTWASVAILALVVAIVAPLAMRDAWRLTMLRFGDERARTLGIDVRRLRFAALMRVSLLAATAVAFVGTIGFVGLVSPHIARMLVGEEHRSFLPASALVGATVMSLASVASKSLAPGMVLPIGIVTALVGVPAYLWLILRRRT